MANPAVTYTFSPATLAKSAQVNQNFLDIINALTDGTKSLAISALTLSSVLGASSGGTGVSSLGNFTDVGTDGIVVTGGTGSVISNMSIAQTKADGTHNGYLSSTDWTTFNNKLSSLTTGNLTEVTSSVLTISGGTGAVIGSGATILVKQSNTSTSGYLSNTDWNTFNGKQASGSYITALTGDVTASGPGSSAATLAATANATLASLDKSTGVAIHGSNTNDSGSAGYVGEWKSVGTAGTSSTFPANSTLWGDMGSLSLTAGDWDVTLTFTEFNNSSTTTIIDIGISTTQNNSATGLVLGDNWVEAPWQATNTADMTICIPSYRMSLSTTTTVYAKANVTTSAGAPKFLYRMSARRMR